MTTGLGLGLGFETEQLSRPAIAALRHRRAGRRRAGRCLKRGEAGGQEFFSDPGNMNSWR